MNYRSLKRKLCCGRRLADPNIDYMTLTIKDANVSHKMNDWSRSAFNKLRLPITLLTVVALIYHAIAFATGEGTLFIIIVFAAILLNQGLWLIIQKIWPSQVTKITWTYCLIHEVLTPLLMFNMLGEAVSNGDSKLYEWWIDMNFIVANIVAFNTLKFTLLLQIPCYFVASFFSARAYCFLMLEDTPSLYDTSSSCNSYFVHKIFTCLLIATCIVVF